MQHVEDWIGGSPYAAALGARLAGLAPDGARLALPYAETNTNGDGVLHGGCAASLAALGAQAVTRASLGPESGPWHTAALQVSYLSAAREQGVVARARLLREGKAMCFVEVDVEGDDGRAIAHATCMTRGRSGAAPADLAVSGGDHGRSDPGVLGPLLPRIPFLKARGIAAEHMVDATSRLVMPWRDVNADADGGVAEGAVLALLDTGGAMASWAVTGAGRYKAGTPAMQAQILAPLPKDDLVAYGRNAQRDAELLWSDVEVAGASDGRIYARGTVVYRIVTGS